MAADRRYGKWTGGLVLCLSWSLFAGPGADLKAQVRAVRDAEIHTMAGDVIPNGVILIEGGKIIAIGGDVRIPPGAEIIPAKGYLVYPGFLAVSDLPPALDNFESITPDVSALDRFEPGEDLSFWTSRGITSLLLAMPENRLVPGKGAVVKTGGDQAGMIVRRDAALNINFGRSALLPPMIHIHPAPVSVDNPLTPARKQYPSSELGAYSVMKELFEPGPFSGELGLYYGNIASSFKEAREKGLPLIIRCQRAADILQALDLAAGTGMSPVILGGNEACRVADRLKAKDVPVIVEVIVKPDGAALKEDDLALDGGEVQLGNLPFLIRTGIKVSLAANISDGGQGVLEILRHFRKYGVSEDELMATITVNPARALGVADRIGTLEKGKDADLVFLRKAPGSSFPCLEKVMISGKMVHEK